MNELNISLDGMDRGKSNVDIVPAGTTIVDNTVDPTNVQPQPPIVPDNTNPTNPNPENSNPTTGEDTSGDSNEESVVEQTIDEQIQIFLSGNNTNLSTEELEDRTKLYDIYGVAGFDVNRNLLDKDGKVVLMYSDVYNFIEKGTLPTNDAGQLVTANGTVISNVEHTSFVDEANTFLQNEYGFGLSEMEEINKIPDETERRNTMYKTMVAVSQRQGVNNFLQSNPVLNDFHNHIRLGGTPQTYKGNGIDYSSVDTEKLGASEKVGLIKELYKLKNLSISDSYIKFVEANEAELTNATNEAIKELDIIYKKQSTENAKLVKEQEEAYAKSNEDYWNGINSIVKKGTLSENTVIPDKDKESFFKYLSNPVKDGLSQEMIDYDNASVEERLLLSYIRFKGKTLDSFIDTRASSNNASKRREVLKNYKPVVTSKGSAPSNEVSFKGISLSNIKTP